MLQPIESVFFPMSKAVVGHTIPGILQRYPVSTVNYFDLTSALKHRKQSEDVVTKFPGMNEDHGKGSSIMEKLKAALNLKPGADPRHTEYSKKDPRFETFREGYERMREDLGWRGGNRPGAPPPPIVPAVLGAPPGLDL